MVLKKNCFGFCNSILCVSRIFHGNQTLEGNFKSVDLKYIKFNVKPLGYTHNTVIWEKDHALCVLVGTGVIEVMT